MKKQELKNIIKAVLVEESIGDCITDGKGNVVGYYDTMEYINGNEPKKQISDIDIKLTNNETREHILKVQENLMKIISSLALRSTKHDASKLVEPEVSTFTEFTPKLKDVTYGSEEYNQFLKDMKPALDNHYKENSHHPEHFGDEGITGMDLLDIIEMICDWKASAERHSNGDIFKSIESNQKRFGYDDTLKQIFINTVITLNEYK